jgi:hypothetical protein
MKLAVRWRLLAVGLALLLATGGMAVMAIGQAYRHAVHDAELTTQYIAQLRAERTQAFVDKVEFHLIRTKVRFEALLHAGADPGPAIDSFIEEEASAFSDLDALRVADAQGYLRWGTVRPLGDRASITNRGYFGVLRDNPEAGLAVDGPFLSLIGNRQVMIFARRLDGVDGGFAGIVVARVRLESFDSLLTQDDLQPRAILSLRRTDLNLIARNPVLPDIVNTRDVSDEFIRSLDKNQDHGTYFAHSKVDNTSNIYSYKKIGALPIVVVVGINVDDYLSGWMSYLYICVALLIVSWCLVAVLIFVAFAGSVRQGRRLALPGLGGVPPDASSGGNRAAGRSRQRGGAEVMEQGMDRPSGSDH